MWMRLLAGATAHEINNLAHGLAYLFARLRQPEVTADELIRLASRGDQQLRALEARARELRALAGASAARSAPAQRLELVFADAVVETEAGEDRSVVVNQTPPEVLAAGSADALRVAVSALLRYALAVTPSGGEVRLGATLEPGFAIATVDAPSAAAPPTAEVMPLEAAPSVLEEHGTFDVVLAGAIAAELGGELRVGPAASGGLHFALALPRVG